MNFMLISIADLHSQVGRSKKQESKAQNCESEAESKAQLVDFVAISSFAGYFSAKIKLITFDDLHAQYGTMEKQESKAQFVESVDESIAQLVGSVAVLPFAGYLSANDEDEASARAGILHLGSGVLNSVGLRADAKVYVFVCSSAGPWWHAAFSLSRNYLNLVVHVAWKLWKLDNSYVHALLTNYGFEGGFAALDPSPLPRSPGLFTIQYAGSIGIGYPVWFVKEDNSLFSTSDVGVTGPPCTVMPRI